MEKLVFSILLIRIHKIYQQGNFSASLAAKKVQEEYKARGERSPAVTNICKRIRQIYEMGLLEFDHYERRKYGRGTVMVFRNTWKFDAYVKLLFVGREIDDVTRCAHKLLPRIAKIILSSPS